MKFLAAALVGFGIVLVILENVARFVVHAFLILFFGYWGYQTLRDIRKSYRTWQQDRAVHKTA